MTGVIVCYSKCWACQLGQCFDPPAVHTWMDREDAEHRGMAWPLTDELEAANPCACRCAGSQGGCVAISGEQAQRITEAAQKAVDRG